MAGKQVNFASNPRPKPNPAALDAFVHGDKPPALSATPAQQASFAPESVLPVPRVPMKRLTFDIPADLHRRMKMACVAEERDMAEVIRELLAARFP
jgi:hypothetical protein